MMKGIIFTDDYSEFVSEATFVGKIRKGINTKRELIKEYWSVFSCPHGGFSWDSLDEILSDMSWLDVDRILILHEDIPKLEHDDLKKYMHILHSNSFFDPDHTTVIGKLDGIAVIFPKKFESELKLFQSNNE